MAEYVKKKKNMKIQGIKELQKIVNVLNESTEATINSKRTIMDSAIPEVLSGALGAGIGAAGSFAVLYGVGFTGLSGFGVVTGLATVGGIVGGGLAAGVFVLAAPVTILAASGVGITSHLRQKHLKQEKERLYQEALKKHNEILNTLKEESDTNNERLDYLNSLNTLLLQAIRDLKFDLGYDV